MYVCFSDHIAKNYYNEGRIDNDNMGKTAVKIE